ncbi:N-acetylmuramoyl-L-alanine amidase family protein [Clostridium beijerinckii]|uniref:Autolysin n=1 Tax=Clostridium beijerinckii TaxID=1520 RepID=A0A1S8SAF4_CLOBE|nr:cadherin-like beta sandwich domain-containing protein [Clostridium beijerinckii]NRY60543.1 glucan-binding YG repeat protein [Clostridium beijerinckii]OOM62586.1 autolysin [Clostridium beijerinckii]
MNRLIKHTISLAVSIGIFSGMQQFHVGRIGIERAYASSYEISDLKIETSNGGDLNLYENDNYTKELDNSKDLESTYYAKLSSDDSKIKFSISGVDSDNVRIFKDRSKKTYNVGEEIPVLTGKTSFYVRVYDTFDEEKPTNYKKSYRIIIKRYTSDEEREIKNDHQGNLYLKSIELDNGDIPLGFSKEKANYSVNVDSSVKSISVKAEPEDGATKVKINNINVDEYDDYKKMVNLDNGNNKIEIELSQDYEDDRKYTINVNRGGNTNITSSNASESNISDDQIDINKNKGGDASGSTSGEPNKWVQVMGRWRHNDSFGNYVKNTWYYDDSYRNNYYFDEDGNMATGWLKLNGYWYYLDTNGAMVTGWRNVGGSWYYLDYNGKMKTGWFKDSNGKYYYLDESNGAMAHDIKIAGYKLGSDGAWVK